MWFFQKCQPWIGNGMGGFVVNAVTELLKIYRITPDQWSEVMDLYNIMLSAYYEIKELEDGKR